jgi:hypothetical protein
MIVCYGRDNSAFTEKVSEDAICALLAGTLLAGTKFYFYKTF